MGSVNSWWDEEDKFGGGGCMLGGRMQVEGLSLIIILRIKRKIALLDTLTEMDCRVALQYITEVLPSEDPIERS